MKAVVKTKWEPQVIEIRDVDKPKIAPDEVLIKVAATGICGTDLEIYDAIVPLPISLPRIFGHEFSGVVTEVGERITDVSIGDNVVAETGIVCRKCRFCKMGKHNLCPNRKPLGLAWDGAFAEYVKVPGINVHVLPDGLSLNEAALTEPTAVAVHAVIERAQVKAGDTMAVIGTGPIGLLTMQCSRVAGASMILSSGHHDNRLKVAKDIGADVIVNEKRENVVKRAKQLTEGFGVDIAFEATGNPSAVKQAIAMTGKGGKVAIIGVHPKPLKKFDTVDIVYNEKTILGCWTHTSSTWERALSLLSSKKINVSPLITHVLPLERIEYGFRLVKNREAIKVLIKPS